MKHLASILLTILCTISLKAQVPADFGFVISYHYTESYSSLTNTFTRMYICDAKEEMTYNDTSIALTLTPKEKQAIYDAIVANKFMQLPETIENDPHMPCPVPSPTLTLEIKMDGKKKTFYQPDDCDFKNKDYAKRYDAVVKLIIGALREKDEYKTIPKSCFVTL